MKFIVIAILMLSMDGYLIFVSDFPADVINIFGFTGVSLILLGWQYWRTYKLAAKGKIGVAEGWVFLDDGFGGQTKAHSSKVFYSPLVVAFADAAVFYKMGQENIFIKEDTAMLTALLNQENALSLKEMSQFLKKIKHPVLGEQMKSLMFMLIFFLAAFYLMTV